MNELLAKLIFGEEAQAKQGLSDPTLQMLMGNKFNMTAPENIKPAASSANKRGKAARSSTSKTIDQWEKEALAKISAEEKAQADAEAKASADAAEKARVAALTPEQRNREDFEKRMKKILDTQSSFLQTLAAGQSGNLKLSLPSIMSPLESEIAIENAKNAVDGLGIGKAEQEILAPYYDQQRKIAEDEITQLKGQKDLTGIMSILDTVAGNKSGYQFTAGDKIKELRKRIDDQMKGRGDLASKKDALLEKFYSASKLSPLSLGLGGDRDLPRASGGGNPLAGAKHNKTLQDEYRKAMTPIVTKYTDSLKNLNKLSDGLKRGDLQSIQANLSVFAKTVSSEAGVLTDSDVSRVIPSNYGTTLAKVQAYLNDTPTAQLKPDFVTGLYALTEIAKKRTLEKYQNDYNTISAPFKAQNSEYSSLFTEGGAGTAMDKQIEGLFGQGKKKSSNPERKARIEQLRKELGK